VHPPEEVLLELASGEADLPQRVLVEGHLSTCPDCRAAAGELARPGGALLRSLAGVPPPDRLWQRVLGEVQAQASPGNPAADPLAGLPLPAGARAELAGVPAPRWRSVWAPGARYAVLARDRGTGAFLVLAHMPPARSFPRHFHPSREDVLVLAGAYTDETGRYTAGTYTSYPPGTCHRPATGRDQEGWILTRFEEPIRFLGWRGWLQRLAPR
jgi:putative transcriptional regulator